MSCTNIILNTILKYINFCIPFWVSFSDTLLLRDGSVFQISLIKFLLFSVHSPSNVFNCSSSADGIELGVFTLPFL